mgnify:CR=1 FL=1
MSGGRTSAYMADRLLYLQSVGHFNDIVFIITFANTGREHEETLIFVNNCEKRWASIYGVAVIWLEAVVYDERLPSGHKEVCFGSASRHGEPFDSVVNKYGLPNGTFLHCTRELKENPIMSYMESIGQSKGFIKNGVLVPATYETWIGIRGDEQKRLKGNRNGKQKKVYPLAELLNKYDLECDIRCVKYEVLDYWEEMPFNLNLPEHLGNCIDCHKKSNKKLAMVYRDMGLGAFKFSGWLDAKYSYVKAQIINGEVKKRKRYRGYMDTKELIASFDLKNMDNKDRSEDDGGCSESCEPFMDENLAEIKV